MASLSNLRLRLASEDDAESVLAIYGPVCESSASTFEFAPPSVEDVRERIRFVLTKWVWIIAEQNEKVIGYAYGGEHRKRAAYQWSVELSIFLDSTSRNQGLGKTMIKALLEILKLQGYVTAFAGTTLPNAGSQGLVNKLGFEEIGVFRNIGYKFDTWHDVGWYQKQIQKPEANQSPPRPLSEVSPEAVNAILASSIAD